MDMFRQDLRYAFRTLRRSPAFALVTVLVLGIGIAAATTMFSVVDGVLLRPLPYRAPGQLVAVWPATGFLRAEYVLARDDNRAFAAFGGYQPGVGFTLSGDGAAERLTGAYATADLFAALGVPPLVGRVLRRGEGRPGAPGVVVLSYGLWRQRYGGDPEIVGRRIELDGTARTVVGVMPADFRFPDRATSIWVPLPLDPGAVGEYWGIGGTRVVGRLRSGWTARHPLLPLPLPLPFPRSIPRARALPRALSSQTVARITIA